jgi:hypothetical protein
MPQINNGKSPPWVSGEIVTAAGLNGMIDSATITPSVITDQTNFSTLTGDEHSLIVDPVSGLLKKTQVKNFLNHGSPVVTNSITNVVSGDNIVIESNGSSGDIQLIAGSGGYLGTISATATTININAVNGTSGTVSLTAGDTISLSTTSNGKVEIGPNVEFVSTSAVKLPVGTTAQRPATPVAGDTRFNSTLGTTETYNGSDWSSTALKVAILTREEPSTAGYSYTYPPTPSVWMDNNFNTISETIPFVVNAASFTGVAGSAGTATITLPAGTYIIEGQASIQSGGGSGSVVVKAINTSTSATIKKGFVSYCASFSHGTSIVQGVVTFASQTSIKFQTMINVASASSNVGNNDGTSEQVFFAKITKLS